MSAVREDGLGRVKLRTLVEQTRLPVAACDAAGQLTLLSPALEELVGQRYAPIPAAEYPTHFRLFAHDGVTPLRVEDVPLTRAKDGEVVRDAVVATRRPDGRLFFLRCNAAPLRSPGGNVMGAVVLVQDVTADKAAETEHGELRDRLMETINHEFRTPLTKLVGHTELLLETAETLPPQARRSVVTMNKATQELRTLLDTVTQLIDLDSHTRLDKRYGDLAELIGDIAAEFTSTFGPSTQLMTQAPPRLSAIIDPLETRRAIWELLKNAVTYGPAGAAIVLHAASDEDSIRISVADRGSGIPPRERERLVHAFERGTHAQQPVNTKGLGLAIAKTVAAAHGGRLELSDNDPNGLRATLVMPRFEGSHVAGD